MAFPKAPNRPGVPVRGVLKLRITAPVTTVVAAEEPPPVVDRYAGSLSLPPLRGFSVAGSLADFAARQRLGAVQRLDEIRTRGCRSCRKQAHADLVARAQWLVEAVCSQTTGYEVALVLGQLPDGDIVLTLTCRERFLKLLVALGPLAILRGVVGESPVEELDVVVGSPRYQQLFQWLCQGGGLQ